jgi:hypothetical protein
MRSWHALWISALVTTSLVIGLSAKEKNWGQYDRLTIIERFLDAIYPDLKHTEGLLFLRTEEFHAIGGALDQVNIVSCKPGSGIVFPNSPTQVLPPNCPGIFLPASSDFLSMTVSFGRKYPILGFDVNGSFVESRARDVAMEIVKQTDWTNEQRTQAVRKSGARFGPDNKNEFLRTLPVQAIIEFTGCELRTTSAEFIVGRQEGEAGHDYAIVQWRINGKRKGLGKLANQPCVARFEPFDGKLLSIAAQ